MKNCDYCGGELFLLGQLGNIKYGRCRNCGADQILSRTRSTFRFSKPKLSTKPQPATLAVGPL